MDTIISKEILAFLGAIIAGGAGFLAARLTSKVQFEIAKLNCEKDIKLQSERITNETTQKSLSILMKKLEELHKILSNIAIENSLTMSCIQSSESILLTEYESRYIENINQISEALAITDLYFDFMSERVKKLYGFANCFWGYQTNIKSVAKDSNKNTLDMQIKLIEEIIQIASNTRKLTVELQEEIVEHSKSLITQIYRDERRG